MARDIWHYPRQELAKQVLGMFENGLSSALVFFAPRRMGKTEFLLKDMKPYASKRKWHVFYFSFLDVGSTARESFTLALTEFALETGAIKAAHLTKRIKKVEGSVSGIRAALEFRDPQQLQATMKEVILSLAKHSDKTLLLLDEIQVLSRDRKNQDFVAALRTMLDVHKGTVKVIFTGSSREGLRRMFSKSDAPFFHFGQNLPFPELQQDFINHLVAVFNRVTKRKIEPNTLWKIFQEMDKVPQLVRSLVERLALNPNLSAEQAKKELLNDITEDREYFMIWETCSILEQLLLKAIIIGETELFSKAKREKLAEQIGVDELPVSTLQSTIRVLQRKNIIGSLPNRGEYYIDDPNFQSWFKRVICIDGKALD